MARLRCSLAVWTLPLLLTGVLAACSPGFVGSDSQSDGTGGGSDEGSGGSDGTGGSDGDGGSDSETGGSSSGGSEPGSGGANSGSGGSNTGGAASSCSDGDVCIAAANFDDECFNPECSSPIAATESEVARDPCLVPWEERTTSIPEECAASSPASACPAICEVQPPCVSASCYLGRCEVDVCLP